MGWHNRLQIQLSRQERRQIDELLSGGVQPVRVVIRALVLRQMDDGRSSPHVELIQPFIFLLLVANGLP
jgi:hypothetical protein